MSYQVLARKYRPQSFEEVIGQEHITRTLKNAVGSQRVAHGFLFSGMRGVGKTTLARILAKALNCEQGPTPSPCNRCGNCREITEGCSVDVLEIDGASNTSVDDIRELRQNVLYAPASARYKIYIIDEVHMLSKSAFNALLKTLEEPPPHVIFVFATTEQHKIPFTIQSRCQCFHFRRISLQQISGQLLNIAEQEGFSLDPESAHLIARASEGSMRDAQSLLDQTLSFCGDDITIADARLVLGVIDQEVLDESTHALVEQDAERILNVVDKLHTLGVDLVEFCKELQFHLRNLLMIKILKRPGSVVPLSEEEIETLRPLTADIEEDRLLAFVEHLDRTEEEVRRSTHPRIVLEMALVKMTRIRPLRDFKEILEQLEALEQGAGAAGPGENRCLNRNPAVTERAVPEPTSKKPGQDDHHSKSSAAVDWEKVVSHANRVYPLVGSILEHGFLERAEPRRVVIGFKKKIHYDMAKEKEKKILEMFGSFLQRDQGLEFSLHNGTESGRKTLSEKKEEQSRKKREQLEQESLGNHIVQDALKIFKGKILEVRDFGAGPDGR